MDYISKIIKATISFDNKEISIQDWVSCVLGEEWRNIYSDEYCRRAEKFFSLFINKLDKNNLEDTDINSLNNIIEREFNLKREKEKDRWGGGDLILLINRCDDEGNFEEIVQ